SVTDWCARVKNFFQTEPSEAVTSDSPMTLPPSTETPRRRLIVGGVVALATISLALLTGQRVLRAPPPPPRGPGPARAGHARRARGGPRRQAPPRRLGDGGQPPRPDRRRGPL